MDDHDHTTGPEGGKDSTVSGSGSGNGNGSECVSGVNESLKHLTIDEVTVTNDSKETETLSTCEKIDKSLKTLYFLLERSKILLAHEECVRLQDIFAFASSGDHSAACPLRNECPLFNDEQRKSLQEIFDKLVIRSAEINDVMVQCHEFSHSGELCDVDDSDVNKTEEDDHDDDGGWVLGSDMFGVKTYYKTDEADGQISLRMEAEQDVPVFEQMVRFVSGGQNMYGSIS